MLKSHILPSMHQFLNIDGWKGVDTCESCNNHFMSCFDDEMEQSSPAGDNLSLATDKSRYVVSVLGDVL